MVRMVPREKSSPNIRSLCRNSYQLGDSKDFLREGKEGVVYRLAIAFPFPDEGQATEFSSNADKQ